MLLSRLPKPSFRTQHGSLAAVFLALFTIMSLALGTLAVDVAHVTTVKCELQNAVDAAALGGAQDLIEDYDSIPARALNIANNNKADGRAVSNNSPNTIVTVYPIPPSQTDTGSVQVSAQMTINHLLAPIIGRTNDVIYASSLAGGSGTLNQLNGDQAFPLAVSIDAIPQKLVGDPPGIPLYQRQVGQSVEFYINSQQVKNAAFTSFTESSANANYIKDAIDQSLGLAPVEPGFIPSITVNDEINLNNGVVGQKKLADSPQLDALLAQPLLILPVISGTPPYNQSRPVIGFIGVKVTAVEVNGSGGEVETITCTIVKAIGRGRGGPTGLTGDASVDQGMITLSIGPVRLLSD
ncbi:MAG: Tad domain-containing protein [Candidatus Melainabacteria bacterium]|nr:Tad domain-containing protein [Candidatus Melainabacteria bacterium]